MTTRWIDGLKVTEYPRKSRPSSFCFLDARAPNGRVSRSLLKGELLEARVRSELAKLDNLGVTGVLGPGEQSRDEDEAKVKEPSRAGFSATAQVRHDISGLGHQVRRRPQCAPRAQGLGTCEDPA